MNQKIADFLRSQTYEIHTSEEPGYDYLQAGEHAITIFNPYSNENIAITCQSDGFILHFAGWSGTYQSSEEELERMLADAENIMNDDSYVWSVVVDSRQMIGLVYDAQSMFPSIARQSAMLLSSAAQADLIDLENIQQDFYFWNPEAVNPVPSMFLN